MRIASICGKRFLYNSSACFMPSPPFTRFWGRSSPKYALSFPFVKEVVPGVIGFVTLSTGPGGGKHSNMFNLYAFAADAMNSTSCGKGEGTGMWTAAIEFEVASGLILRPIDAA